MSGSNHSTPWWGPFYDDLLAEVLLVRKDDGELEQTLSFVEQELGLKAPARVYDQCCGIGSLSLPLAARGFEVVAVDQAAGYVERAVRDATQQGLRIEAHAADAFEFVPSQPVDAVLNWWTSFGYTDDDAQNAKMLNRAFEALVPGGHFAIDYMNVPGVLNGFAPVVVTERETPRGPIELTRTTRLDLVRGRMHKLWRYEVGGSDPRVVEHESTVRLYLPHRLADLMRGVGFESIRGFGGVDGSPLELTSGRCILVGRKPV